MSIPTTFKVLLAILVLITLPGNVPGLAATRIPVDFAGESDEFDPACHISKMVSYGDYQFWLMSWGWCSVSGYRLTVSSASGTVLDTIVRETDEVEDIAASDLDSDGGPEALVTTRHGNHGYGELDVYELVAGKLQKRAFPYQSEIKGTNELDAEGSYLAGGQQFNFGPNQITEIARISRRYDAGCCPSGGYVTVTFALKQDIFVQTNIEIYKAREVAPDVEP